MKKKFEENINIRVTSAQIGISKLNWNYAKEEWKEEEAIEFMKNESYDVLPIKSKTGKYEKYWSTRKIGNYDSLLKKDIKPSNQIYYLTELKDLLIKLQESENASFFLTDYEQVNGLVSNVHLNSKPVYVYFYNLISKCEIELGLLIKELIPETEIIKLIEEKSKNPEDSLSKEVLKRYNSNKNNFRANHFIEYLYLNQFQYLLKEKSFISLLGYSSKTQLSKDFKIINKYRNWLAHPLNSPKENMSKDLHTLHKTLEKLLENINSINPTLLKAYLETSYETNKPPIIKLRIGKSNAAVDKFMKEGGFKKWVFISAENPYSRTQTAEENALRNSRLEGLLKNEKYTFFEGKGIPKDPSWKAENSFLVMDMTKDKAIELCKKFQQNAFVYGAIESLPELVFHPKVRL